MNETTTNSTISVKVALALAEEAITAEGGSPLDAKCLVAMAMQESGLNPNAWGDHGAAHGLFQFHRGTWGDHADKDWTRDMPLPSFRVAIRYAKRGNRLLSRTPQYGHDMVHKLWSHHNVGNVRTINTKYVSAVQKRYNTLP